MDEQVLRSLIKWPNVPDCFGWLALDRRGQWCMVDEFAQQNQLPGQIIQHAALNECIRRNYASDSFGRFFFQNGPQRVFITLAVTPWVARIIPSESGSQIVTQCHKTMEPSAALSDEQGNIYILGSTIETICTDFDHQQFETAERSIVALLHDHDLDLFSELAKPREEVCSFGGSWNWHGERLPLDPIHSDELSKKFGFIQHPQPI
ncbi:DUF2946 family protein [Polynucleobacter necessarius]|uniref:DUF2946 family protein n=1 Tax=Polynucleobacter necessarius TaxID=576610 RepID=UPI000E09A7B5|nr:DUF2946 family protein [Polynucleobacter necessarius]